ncbi:hypothetical protein C8R47DRAFT_135006 [Mycena vitilis]|nr:hypothetical protein C8R47DRAFT_135006 [Mycena vitilis]
MYQGFVTNSNKFVSKKKSYDRNEAQCEAALLRAAGATLHPCLGSVKNPWGSSNAHSAEMKLYTFYAGSGWLAGVQLQHQLGAPVSHSPANYDVFSTGVFYYF